MKKRVQFLFGLSLALNVALVAWLVRDTDAPQFVAAAAAHPTPTTPEIDGSAWTGLHSDDLPTLVARLRSGGFPPEIVHAILRAELDQALIARRRQLDPEEATRPFWKTASSDPKINAEINRLRGAHAKILRQLLGTDQPENPFSAALGAPRWEALPPDKVDRAKRIIRDYDEMKSDLYLEAGGTLSREGWRKTAAIEQAQREDLAQLLTPAEFLDYNLRSSQTAYNLRGELSAFRPSEEEFRTIYQAQQLFYDQTAGLEQGSDEYWRQWREADKQRIEQIKALLGTARAADYERATDFTFRQASTLVARLGLPDETANQVWSLAKDIQQRNQALGADGSLSREQRAEGFATLADEADAKLSAVLGSAGLEAYRQHGGQWLQALPRRKPPAPPAP